ncbi:MAG: bifunctional (p)ppGpp synthetase/guanosine-3',5'-bis(diphosphate) 3'-pyrophosphohydrolase [Nitrospirae bacterium]|nr:bifunctional (p)ppGpp synthetase/guanosine-3',5'-bis(diphosphate) 3'-pyrophosphohydrolase [Nitrospirota bacterium]
MITSDELIRQVLQYNPKADTALLEKSCEFTAAAHAGQTRKTGEPYLHHPLEVASILARMKMDISSIVVGLLHDTVEDCTVTREELTREFGEDIARLVEGLTKISKVEFKSHEAKQAENFRKMVMSMSQDIRVILIKLADRLHNMRTLDPFPPPKQKRIAQETLEIYAPIANRLGIGWMKVELEDLCFRYLNPEVYQDLVLRMNQKKEEREQYIREVIQIVEDTLKTHGIQARVFGRTKHFYSIYLKMEKQGIPFDEVYDLTGVRIVTDTQVNCYAILGTVHTLWTPIPGRFKDYIGVPKSNMYQSLHTTIIGPKGHRVEFQIRTEEMHRVAEEGIAAHWKYKERGQLDATAEEVYPWLRQIVEWQKDLSDDRQFMDSVKVDLFPDVIYVFTPKGDVKELIRGTTPVDFAYAIHTEVGNRCVGAKVNGKLVPLRHLLKNGDTVEVITNPNHVPSKDWLKFVRTPRAKAKIKHVVKLEERRLSLDLGKKLLEKEAQKFRINPTRVYKAELLGQVFKDYGVKDIDELLVGMGYGKVSAKQVVRRLFPETVTKEDLVEEKTAKPRPSQGLRIKGAEDLMIHFSKCCNPLPGDRIFGYITRGRGISIHTVNCPNLDELDYDKERLIEVDWEGVGTVASHSARISVIAMDRPGMLASVSSTITSLEETNISHAEITTTEDKKAVLNFAVEIKNLGHLEELIQKIQQVDGVLSVKRIMRA